MIEDYNAAHPDHPVKLEASENFQVADAYTWVLEGRYDGYFSIELAYKKMWKQRMLPIRTSRIN